MTDNDHTNDLANEADNLSANDDTPAARVTGETPVVRSLDDVPVEVLDELTAAFHVPVAAPTPASQSGNTVVIDGFDLVSDDDLTHAARPPLVIEDRELTTEIARDSGLDDADGRPHRRFRLRRIAVNREMGRRRLRVLTYIGVPVAVIGVILVVLASPLFGVRNIDVEGVKYTADATLRAAKDQVDGKSIFSVDLGAAESILARDPWVRDARATREFPSTVRFEISERRPVAWFTGADNQARILDVDGFVIAILVGQPTGYMQITGVGPDLPAGAQADDVYTAAAQMAASLPPEIANAVLNVGVVNGTDVVMTLRSGTLVQFGQPTDLRAKLVSLVLVLRRQDPANLASIDLSSGDPIFAVK
jgi:cell division protein FtsQ